jgi:hypothetical protein
MRESAFSSAAWEKLVKERVTADVSLHLLPAGSVRLQVSKLQTSTSMESRSEESSPRSPRSWGLRTWHQLRAISPVHSEWRSRSLSSRRKRKPRSEKEAEAEV